MISHTPSDHHLCFLLQDQVFTYQILLKKECFWPLEYSKLGRQGDGK